MPRESLQTLTEPMYYVLLALVRPLCGIEIMERVDELSHGRLAIGPGTLYSMLKKFEENGLIAPAMGPDSPPKRKTYAITPRGVGFLKQEYERLKRQAEDGKAIMEELV